jgi:hypothetical protein
VEHDASELARDQQVIGAATPGPWHVHWVDDDLSMNARVIAREDGTGERHDHKNNVAIVLLQHPQYADVGDGRWDENAEFIVRARLRWPELVAQVRQLEARLTPLERENATLRAKLANREASSPEPAVHK